MAPDAADAPRRIDIPRRISNRASFASGDAQGKDAERIAHEARTVLNGGDPASRLSDSALTLAERHRAQLADRLTSSKDPAEQVGINEDVA
jgi:hypothetical protein